MLSPALRVTIAFLKPLFFPSLFFRDLSLLVFGLTFIVLTAKTETPKVFSTASLIFRLEETEETENKYLLKLEDNMVAFSVSKASFNMVTDSFTMIPFLFRI